MFSIFAHRVDEAQDILWPESRYGSVFLAMTTFSACLSQSKAYLS